MLTRSARIVLVMWVLVVTGVVAASAQTGVVSGTVTPVDSGATVTVRNTNDSSYQQVDADPSTGYYLVSGLADGDYEVIVDAAYYVVQIAEITISYGTPVVQDFTLQAAGSISGSITPVGSEVQVIATDASTGLSFGIYASTSDGTFLISQMPPGTYQLCVNPESAYLVPPCEPSSVIVTAGQESSGHLFALSLGGSIAGSVTPAPTDGGVFAIPTGSMDLKDCIASAKIDSATGAYTLLGLPSGTYNLAFWVKGYVRDVGVYTGVANSTLTSQDTADITGVINSWVQANESMNTNGVLSLLADDYTEVRSGRGKSQIGPILEAQYAVLQSLDVAYSVDVVKGVTGVSAVAVVQTNETYTPTGGSPRLKRVQGLFAFTKASGSWLFSSGNPWKFDIVYEPLEGETTPIIVNYKQDPAISNISVTVGQEIQVPAWTLTPAQ